MKRVILTTFLVFFVAAVVAESETENYPNPNTEFKLDGNDYDFNQGFIDFVKGKFGVTLWYKALELLKEIKKTNCPNFEKDVQNLYNEINACGEKAISTSSTKTLCQVINTNLGTCYQPLRDLLEKCMPPKAKDIPKLIGKIGDAIVGEACNSTVEQVLELFNPCQFNKKYTDFPSCRDSKTEVENFKEKFPTKTFVCTLLPKAKQCSKDRHNASCSNPVSKVAFTNFYEAIDVATKEICERK